MFNSQGQPMILNCNLLRALYIKTVNCAGIDKMGRIASVLQHPREESWREKKEKEQHKDKTRFYFRGTFLCNGTQDRRNTLHQNTLNEWEYQVAAWMIKYHVHSNNGTSWSWLGFRYSCVKQFGNGTNLWNRGKNNHIGTFGREVYR